MEDNCTANHALEQIKTFHQSANLEKFSIPFYKTK